MTIRLTNSNVLEAPIDGQRTLLRCGGDDPPPPATALALTEAQLGALYDGGGTGGEPPPPGGYLYVFFDQSAQPAGMTCSDPYALNQGCDFDREVMIVSLALGPGRRQLRARRRPGRRHAQRVRPQRRRHLLQGRRSGGFSEGTVEVLAIDGSSVQIRVTSPRGNPEGTAARCP
ncbi:MAG: hypothetical protein IPG04_09465 [Polyangiaceae bacterium]|nr:hypothetical protein [Polyangiaceae bacterium]